MSEITEQPENKVEASPEAAVQAGAPAPSWKEKARCFYAPSGALVVDYGDAPSWPPRGLMMDMSYTAAPAVPYYTSEALNSNFCSQCNRSFASANAVLQHLRDSQAHRDQPEAYEAAYIIKCQEEGYLPPIEAHWDEYAIGNGWGDHSTYSNGDESTAVMAAPSDIYTPSDAGSGQHGEDGVPVGVMSPDTPLRSQFLSPTRGKAGRAGRAHGARAQQERTAPAPPPPKLEDESAFPPLSGSRSPAPTTPKQWVTSPSKPSATPPTVLPSEEEGTDAAGQVAAGRKLRAEAVEYQPSLGASTPASPTAADAVAATGATLSAKLRVSAPEWAPPA